MFKIAQTWTSRLPCLQSHAGTSLQDCSAWHSWDLVEHTADSHRRSHWLL